MSLSLHWLKCILILINKWGEGGTLPFRRIPSSKCEKNQQNRKSSLENHSIN